MEYTVFPTDLLIDIFSYLKSKYAIFRQLTRATSRVKISWDGWDSLIEQGYYVVIDRNHTEWFLNGKLNSFLDLPASEYLTGGTKFWFKNGLRHRDNDLPAYEHYDGTKMWHRNGLRHRDNDLPATVWWDGTKHWFKNGKQHRDNDLPAEENADGTKAWYRDGVRYLPLVK